MLNGLFGFGSVGLVCHGGLPSDHIIDELVHSVDIKNVVVDSNCESLFQLEGQLRHGNGIDPDQG